MKAASNGIDKRQSSALPESETRIAFNSGGVIVLWQSRDPVNGLPTL
jgi:hypothetical protein